MTEKTQPTDAELDMLIDDVAGLDSSNEAFRKFARAVLAKWGTHESGEDLYWRLHSLSKTLEGSGLIDESQHPDAYSTILDAMAFVRGHPAENLYDTQAQAGAVPLPPASPCAMTEAEYRLFKLGWLEAEAAHGIGIKKGDSHA